jgi:hypothetical protein
MTVELAKVLRINTGTILIPYTVEAGNLTEFETYNRELTHLLALIPDEHKDAAETEDDGFHIMTDCIPALKYAVEHYFLDDFSTTIDVVCDTYGEDVCDGCLDDLIEQALEEYEYTSKILSDGVYLTRE